MNQIDDALGKRATQEHLLISKLPREDLEDKYLKIYDENIILKKHARKQEDRIKKMATKLFRLVNDKKKSVNTNLSGKPFRDIQTEEYVADLEAKLSDLDMINKRLKENLQTCRMQLQTLQAQKNSVSTVYSNVTARIDTGLTKIQKDPSLTKNMRTLGNLSYRSNNTGQFNLNYNDNNINNGRQIQELELENAELKNRIEDYQAHIETINEKIARQKEKYEDVLQKFKSQVSQDHMKAGVQENIDQIRLQRELKDKSNHYSELFSKFNHLSENHVQLKDNHDRLLEEIERFNQQIKQEQQRNISLKSELKNLSQSNRQILELKGRIDDLEKENETLKETNQKLLTSAFSLEREREFRERERSLKVQIAQLEATLKSDVSEKGSILDRLTNERDQYDKLNNEMREMQIKYYEMKQKYDDMNDKMQFLSKESQIDFKEIEEALIIVKDRKSIKTNEETFLTNVDAEKMKIVLRKTTDLEAHLAETISELEKSRHLLITQVKINNDYKKEVLLIQKKMEENKSEFDAKILEYAQMLDIRAARIKKLEKQLNDIAYGTKQVNVGKALTDNFVSGKKGRRESFSYVGSPSSNMLDHHLIANLERGQNIFEIHLTRLILSEEAIRILSETDPSTFCTIEFFEHELQTTPIVKGRKADYNFTSQYIVKVDDFFLHYLQKETTTIELHQAIGSDYTTKAACQISFRELIDQQVPRLHGSVNLMCVTENNHGISFGNIEYWARLIVPVDEAFRLYKERTKALGYLSSNIKEDYQPKNSKKAKSIDNMNELKINLLRCSKLNIGNKKSQPSAYCVYKFYDYNDHDTQIIASSNYPEFDDHKSFTVLMDIDLDNYLKKETLEIYVFDDNEPESTGNYLGIAKIPLIALAHDNEIKGTFELKQADGNPNGMIDLTIFWSYSYLPPSESTFSATDYKQPIISKKKSEQNVSNGIIAIESNGQTSSQKSRVIGYEPKTPKEISNVKLSDKQKFQEKSNIYNQEIKQADTSDEADVEDSLGNATIHGDLPADISEEPKTFKKPASKNRELSTLLQVPTSTRNNPHYNDTIFGDDQNELDSLRSNYQNNLANNNRSDDDENEHQNIGEEIEDNISDQEDQLNENEENFKESQKIKENYMNYTVNNSTQKSEDGVVISKRGSWDPNETSNLPKHGNEDCVIIEISNFSFRENSNVLNRKEVKKLFVGMNFLNYDPGELESKSTMPKPKANEAVFFNFRKIFNVDAENNIDKRRALARMLVENEVSFFSFAVVSEPDSDEEDCEDIGYSYVDVQELMKLNANYHDKELNLFDANNENIVIGKMVVTVEMIDALNAIKKEINLGSELAETF